MEMRLHQIENEGQPPPYDIALKDIPSMTVLSVRASRAGMVAFDVNQIRVAALLLGNLKRARIKADGPLFALMPELPTTESELDIEFAIPVKLRRGQRAGDWGSSPLQLRELKAVPSMASTISKSGASALSTIYTTLFAWMQANAYKVAGSYREIYLSEAGDKPQASAVHSGFLEVQCPVERAQIPLSVISTQFNQKDKIMQPKFVNKQAFTTVGFSYVGKNQNGEVPQLWGTFNQQANKIKNMVGNCAYGACFSDIEFGEDGDFEYVACYEVSDFSDIPEGTVVREVPAHKYAVFTHHGKLDNLQETYKYIYETWLPQADVELVSPHFDMELYDDRFLFDDDASEFDVYIAIKE